MESHQGRLLPGLPSKSARHALIAFFVSIPRRASMDGLSLPSFLSDVKKNSARPEETAARNPFILPWHRRSSLRTRRASEGSASEPSLARRVSMCKDAKLSCRGNTRLRSQTRTEQDAGERALDLGVDRHLFAIYHNGLDQFYDCGIRNEEKFNSTFRISQCRVPRDVTNMNFNQDPEP